MNLLSTSSSIHLVLHEYDPDFVVDLGLIQFMHSYIREDCLILWIAVVALSLMTLGA